MKMLTRGGGLLFLSFRPQTTSGHGSNDRYVLYIYNIMVVILCIIQYIYIYVISINIYLPEVDGCFSLPPGLELVPRDVDKP